MLEIARNDISHFIYIYSHLFMGFIIQSLKNMVTLKLTYLAGKLLEESFV
jgi:hypothetical protein